MTSPVSSEFRTEIDDLARSAEREFAAKEKELAGRRSGERRRLTGILCVGGLLILLEAGFLVFQLAVHEASVTEHAQPHALQSEQSCAGERYRTFRALIAYRKDFGRWPTTLAEIVGPYAERLPADPTTGLPLVYEAQGERFSLACVKP